MVVTILIGHEGEVGDGTVARDEMISCSLRRSDRDTGVAMSSEVVAATPFARRSSTPSTRTPGFFFRAVGRSTMRRAADLPPPEGLPSVVWFVPGGAP